MNKHFTQNTLRFLLLISIIFFSGCVQSTATDVPLSTPSSTIIPVSIYPKGHLIYSNEEGIYSLDIQSQEIETISTFKNQQYHSIIAEDYIYTLRDIKGDGSQAEIFRLARDGTNLEQLTFDGNKYGFEISPSGNYLAYSLETNQLKLFDVANKTSQTIAQQDGYTYSSQSWSPDNSKIAFFASPIQSKRPVGRLFLYTRQDKYAKQFLPGMMIYTTPPAWSPNGEDIILNIEYDLRTGTQGIFIFNVNTNNLEKIADKTTGNGFVWSPMGDMILYVDSNGQLNLFDLKNKSATLIQKEASGYYFQYDTLLWSPDGKYIGYISCSNRTIKSGPYEGISALDSCLFTIQDIDNGRNIEIEIPVTFTSSISWIYP